MSKLLPLSLLFFILLVGCKDSKSGEEKVEDRKDVEAVIADTSPTSTPATSAGEIRVDTPKPGAVLTPSSFQIKGSARTFENTLLYRLVFDSVVALASGFTTSDASEAGEFGSFSIQVELTSDFSGDAVLEVFEESAESGEEINMVRVPVKISASPGKKTRPVFVYFPNSKMGSLRDCKLVYPLTRELPEKSQGLIRGAIYYMLKGLSQGEVQDGYRDIIPEGLRLNRVSLEDGVARLDFSHQLNQVKRSCDAESLRAQIEQTLAQFQTVDAVVITADGASWKKGL